MLKARHGIAALLTSAGAIVTLGVGTAAASPAAPAQYTVQPGDTLSAIATRYSTSVASLVEANQIPDANLIYAGEVLTLSGSPASPSPSAVAADGDGDGDGSVGAPAQSTTPDSSTAPAAVQASAAVPVAAASSGGAPSGVWSCIANLESGSNPTTNTGNGYYGMFQFSLSSWQMVGGQGNPANASVVTQLAMAQRLQAVSGWGAWPVTSRLCGA